MVKYIGKIVLGEDMYHIKDIEARASIDNKPDSDDFENLGDALTILTVDDAIAEAEKLPSVISFSEDTANVDEGSTITKTVTVTAGDGAVTYSSSDTDVATVNSSGVVTGVNAGICTITATIASTSTYKAATASYTLTVVHPDPYGGHDYVEIGGVKWATMNVGANSITDTGLYFQWGDTQGYTAEQCGSGEGKKNFRFEDYKYGNGTSNPGSAGMTKYNSTDGKKVLEASDDAVQANWGGQWRMPTKAEYNALTNAVTIAWTTNYQDSGVAGVICTDKTDSSNVLFFPACGRCYANNIALVGNYCLYWSSSLNDAVTNLSSAISMLAFNTNMDWEKNPRAMGNSVRGVIG